MSFIKVLAILAAVMGLFVWGFAFMLGWGWFVVPLGVPPITFWHAVGLKYLIAAATMLPFAAQSEGDLEKKSLAYLMAGLIVMLLLWVFSLLM